VVEHLLAKEKVAGSIPVSRSLLFQATSPSGKARLCKSCTSGSNPLVASQHYVIKLVPSPRLRCKPMRQQHSYSSEAIVLKRIDLGEADRVLTLFTPHKGKVHVIAKGVRRITSKRAGHLELLSHSQLQLALGRTFDIVTQAEARESFLHLRSEMWHTTCGFYLAELVDRFIEDNTEHSNVYNLLLNALRCLDADALEVQHRRAQGTLSPEQEYRRTKLLLRYFELHLLFYVGYEPALQQCAHCASELRAQENGFKPSLGGVLCPQCSQFWERSISVKALKTLLLLRRSMWADIPFERLDVHLDRRLEAELEAVLHGLLRFHLERDLKSWSFLEMLSVPK
jgi:DNA repair protein RecO (recombination protein O)